MGEIYFTDKDVTSIDDFSRQEIEFIIRKAREMKERELSGKRYSDLLKDKVLAELFYEPSTRTRTSFERAMRELGGDVFGFSSTEGTSVSKRESLFMTVKMFEAYHADALVIRHPKDGSAQWAADVAVIPVINGGDGRNEHPTQTLLDLCTIHEILKGKIDGSHIAFGGDLKYGRTVHSLPLGLSKFKRVTLHLAAPEQLAMDRDFIERLRLRGMKVIEHKSLKEAFEKSQIFYMTRIQLERMKDKMPEEKARELAEKFTIKLKTLDFNPGIKIMHPMPIDSVMQEIEFPVVFSKSQYFLPQAQTGVFARKALLSLILAKARNKFFEERPRKELITPSNIVKRKIKKQKYEKFFYIDRIQNGTIIDHIQVGKGSEITELFHKKGCKLITAFGMPPEKPRKDIVKIFGYPLNQRIIKTIIMISPDVTFNIIKDSKVIEKFKAILCSNENCITRVIEEDVPAKFCRTRSGKLECHYCGHKQDIELNLSRDDRREYVNGLPLRR